MATVAEFALGPDEFPLGTIFRTLPEATVHLERVVPNPDGAIPYFWVHTPETDDLGDQFAEHPGVRDIRIVDTVKSQSLLRCEWVSGHDIVLDGLVDPAIVLLSAVGTRDGWTFEVRGETRESIATFQKYCHEHDVPITLTELHTLRPRETKYELTEKQREALTLAFERGYFDSPREATLEAIADELEISQQALASRLRRGNRRLVKEAIVESRR